MKTEKREYYEYINSTEKTWVEERHLFCGPRTTVLYVLRFHDTEKMNDWVKNVFINKLKILPKLIFSMGDTNKYRNSDGDLDEIFELVVYNATFISRI